MTFHDRCEQLLVRGCKDQLVGVTMARRPDRRTGSGERFSYVTILMGDGDYWKGVIGLAKSLKLVRARYPLLVAVSRDVPGDHRDKMEAAGCQIREVEDVDPPKQRVGGPASPYAVPHYSRNYTKLRIWEFDDYSRLVFLDADMLVAQNLDELFTTVPWGEVGAALDCFCEGWSHPPSRRKNGYCQVAARTPPWPGPEPAPRPYFNCGMMVLHPDRALAARMLAELRAFAPSPMAEQDFLHEFFPTFHALPSDYNMLICLLWNHPDVVSFERVKVVHYSVTGAKPWAYNPTADHMHLPVVAELVRRWQLVYDQVEQPWVVPRSMSTSMVEPLANRMAVLL